MQNMVDTELLSVYSRPLFTPLFMSIYAEICLGVCLVKSCGISVSNQHRKHVYVSSLETYKQLLESY
jgi:hypothetical protein